MNESKDLRNRCIEECKKFENYLMGSFSWYERGIVDAIDELLEYTTEPDALCVLLELKRNVKKRIKSELLIEIEFFYRAFVESIKEHIDNGKEN